MTPARDDSIEDLLALSFSLALYLSARRNVVFFPFFWSVQWQVSLNEAEIHGRKGERTDSDFLAASHDSTSMRSSECSCQLCKSTSRRFAPRPALFFFRYPEQHDKNNNALLTGQCIVTVQSSLAVDLRSPGFFSVLICDETTTKKRQKTKKCSVVKTIVNCSPIRISASGF